jgi:hypothetical protein
VRASRGSHASVYPDALDVVHDVDRSGAPPRVLDVSRTYNVAMMAATRFNAAALAASALSFALAVLACTSGSPVTDGTCVVTGLRARPADSMVEACEVVRRRFVELTGRPAAQVSLTFEDTIVLHGSVEGARVVLRLPAPAVLARSASRLGVSEAPFGGSWDEALTNIARHEIGHVLLAAALHDTSTAKTGKQYGTWLPDWLDEAVAQWGETEHSRGSRMAQARAAVSAVGPLRDFVTRSHPLIAQDVLLTQVNVESFGPCRGDCGPRYRAGTRTVRRALQRDGTVRTDTTWTPPDSVPAARVEELYYPVSLSIVSFVRERFGSTGAAELFARLQQGAASVDALGALMPQGGFDAFEREWRTWLCAKSP